MSKVDPEAFYAYAYRGGRDAMEILAIVPEDVFRVFKKHEDELERGNIPDEAEEVMDTFWECEDIMHRFSEDDISEISPDRWVRIVLC